MANRLTLKFSSIMRSREPEVAGGSFWKFKVCEGFCDRCHCYKDNVLGFGLYRLCPDCLAGEGYRLDESGENITHI